MRIIGDDMRKAQQTKANVLEVKSEHVVTEGVAVKVCRLPLKWQYLKIS
jgi:hypothetical protein